MTTTDLFTGALSYENKFSLDAKPISGGVRFLSVSFSLVFCFLPREREKDLEREMDSSLLFFQNKMLALEKGRSESVAFLSLSLLCFSKKKTLTFALARRSLFKKKNSRSLRRLKAPTARPGR
jgi:hypothetical protein